MGDAMDHVLDYAMERHGLCHGLRHGLYRGLCHGLTHGLYHGLCHGICRGLIHGLRHGLCHGIRQWLMGADSRELSGSNISRVISRQERIFRVSHALGFYLYGRRLIQETE